MTVNLHTVKVVADPREDYPAEVTFTCAGDRTAPCHQYPACDCEEWGAADEHEHPSVPHDECWMQGWMDAGEYSTQYEGDDATDDDLSWPTVSREGPVDIRYEYGYVSWRWVS